MTTYSPYPYAPLHPLEVPSRLSSEAMIYGIKLANGGRTEETDQAAGIVADLERRLRADALQAEDGPRPAVTR